VSPADSRRAPLSPSAAGETRVHDEGSHRCEQVGDARSLDHQGMKHYLSSEGKSHVTAGPADYQRTLWRGGPAAMANRFRRATNDVIGFVHAVTDDQWKTVDAAEGLSIGAMVHHLAAGDRLTRTVLEAMAQGLEHPSSDTQQATENRQRLQAYEAAEFEHLSRAATIELLRQQGAEVARTVSSLSSTDLDRVHTFWGETVLTREFIQRWIEDIEQHLVEMRSTAGSRNRQSFTPSSSGKPAS